MGFGLLFIGYFTATVMSLNTLGGVFAFIGFLIMLIASKKLMQYDGKFLLLVIASALLMLLSAVSALSDVSALLYRFLLIPSPIVNEAFAATVLNVRLVLDLVFTALLCYCVRSIAKQTGADKIAYLAVRNFVFYCISFVLQLLVWLASNMQWEGLVAFVSGTALPVWMIIVNIVCLLLNCVMLFSCYSKICDENDVDMPQKPSRFAFINKRREEKEQRRLRYMQEAEEYLKQKNESKNEPKKGKKR